jgi:hypothetical protein
LLIQALEAFGLEDGCVEIALCDFRRRTWCFAVAAAQDNTDGEPAARASGKLLPQLSGAAVLATSRLRQWSAAFKAMRLDVLHGYCLAGLLRTARGRVAQVPSGGFCQGGLRWHDTAVGSSSATAAAPCAVSPCRA